MNLRNDHWYNLGLVDAPAPSSRNGTGVESRGGMG